MATTINLSDPISTVVTKTNTLITEVGDKATLNTATTTNLVAAINEINTKVVAIDTDAEIGAKVEAFFAGSQLDVGGINADSADFDSATITTLKSTNGTITNGTITTLTNTNAAIDSAVITDISGSSINYDSATFNTLNMEAVALDNIKPLQIKNSAGTVVLAGYLLSTSNTDGTL